MNRGWNGLLAAVLATLVPALSATAGDVDVGAYTRKDQFNEFKISPGGEYYDATVPLEDRTMLVVIDRATNKLTGSFKMPQNNHVADFHWVSKDRLVMSAAQKFGLLDKPQYTGELFAIDADGGRPETLVGYRVSDGGAATTIKPKKGNDKIWGFLVDAPPVDEKSVLISAQPYSQDPYSSAERLDVYTGRLTRMAKAPIRGAIFQTDNQGYVVTPDGARLQVFAPNAGGAGFDVGRLSDLQLLTTDSPPAQTGLVNLMVTLPGNASPPVTSPFDPADPNSYNASSGGVTVYDSLGVSHVQTSYFVKTGTPNEWQVYNYVDGTSVGGPTTLQFSDTGALQTPATGEIALDPYAPTTGAGTLNMTLNLSGSTQYGSEFALRSVNQDGYAAGKLSEISVSEDGVVFARYSNGDDRALGQVALTQFVNPQGLQPQGNNMWAASYTSGSPRTGAPDSSDFGQIAAGSLESSTVDLTEQLVNMIVAQRNFQANAQMISTQDQATQTIINIR